MALGGFARFWQGGARHRLPAAEAYALWADTYPPRPHNPLMEAEQSVVAPMLAATRPLRALDVGTGTGRYLPLLAATGAATLVGVDLSLAMLGRQSNAAPRVCGDACRLPFPSATFGLVCASLMVGDIEDLAGWVREAARVLTPGGRLVHSDFHPAWSSESWRRTFKAADGRAIELAYFPHAIEDHLVALEQASLVVKTIREPRLASRRAPVVVAFHSIKGRSPGRRLP